jgi:hypothetical protein
MQATGREETSSEITRFDHPKSTSAAPTALD